MKPLAIDLFAGLGGWTDGLLAEGWDVVGFDIERHDYGTGGYPAQLVLQDIRTIHGKQFRDAALIVASPPCQEYSYMAMPWSRAKAIRAEYLAGTRDRAKLTELFDACFRIQREAIEAAGHFIPLVVENVRGAQPWVGRSRANFGSYHLWGDVPALMPDTARTPKMSGRGMSLGDVPWGPHHTGLNERATKNTGGSWLGVDPRGNRIEPNNGRRGSKSSARKAASAAIAKIPLPLARHIAQAWWSREVRR